MEHLAPGSFQSPGAKTKGENMADEDIDMENFEERAETASDFAAEDENEKVN